MKINITIDFTKEQLTLEELENITYFADEIIECIIDPNYNRATFNDIQSYNSNNKWAMQFINNQFNK